MLLSFFWVFLTLKNMSWVLYNHDTICEGQTIKLYTKIRHIINFENWASLAVYILKKKKTLFNEGSSFWIWPKVKYFTFIVPPMQLLLSLIFVIFTFLLFFFCFRNLYLFTYLLHVTKPTKFQKWRIDESKNEMKICFLWIRSIFFVVISH